MHIKVTKALQFLTNVPLCTRFMAPKVPKLEKFLRKVTYCLFRRVPSSQKERMVRSFPEGSEKMLLGRSANGHRRILTPVNMSGEN
jgi:hypothetical protein